MKLTSYIVDDEPHAVELLTRFISSTPGLELCGGTLQPQEALAVLQGPQPPMLAFIDIDLPEISGITLAGHCQAATLVVLTTSFRQYGPEAFEKNVLDYLLKPFSYERFLQSIEKARRTHTLRAGSGPRDTVFVKAGNRGKRVRLRLDELVLAEGAENFVYLHTATERILAYLTLQEMLTALPPQRFVRIHKSYVVNLDHVTSVENGQVRLDNKLNVPVGRVFAAQFQSILEKRSLP